MLGTLSTLMQLPKAEAQRRLRLYHEVAPWLAWQRAGRNVFSFSPGLLEMLNRTDASGIQVKDLTLPYPAIYVDLSAIKLPFVEGHDACIEGVYISEERNVYIFDDTGEEEDYIDGRVEHVLKFHFVGPYAGNFDFIDILLSGHEPFAQYELWSNAPYGGAYSVGTAIEQAKDYFWANRIKKSQASAELTDEQLLKDMETLDSFDYLTQVACYKPKRPLLRATPAAGACLLWGKRSVRPLQPVSRPGRKGWIRKGRAGAGGRGQLR